MYVHPGVYTALGLGMAVVCVLQRCRAPGQLEVHAGVRGAAVGSVARAEPSEGGGDSELPLPTPDGRAIPNIIIMTCQPGLTEISPCYP